MNTELIVALLVAVLGAGGIAGGIVAFRKAGPERANIMVTTAQLLVGLSREEVERLDSERDRLRIRIDEVEHELGKKIAELEDERDRLLVENAEMAARILTLEAEVIGLRDQVNGTT